MKYTEHNGRFFNLGARLQIILIYIIPILLNMVPSTFLIGWLYPLFIYYYENKSGLIILHALNSLCIQITNNILWFIIVVLAINFKMPLYTTKIELLGYINIYISIILRILILISLLNGMKLKEIHLPLIRIPLKKILDSNPKYSQNNFKQN